MCGGRLKPLRNRLKMTLAQMISPDKAKLGPDNIFTMYEYIHIYIQ